jgi:L-2,4-diaminobutyric acid acetyltransferase
MHHTEIKLQIRATEASDGSRVWSLIKDAGTLDLNSAYSYIMLCDIFTETCAVAVSGDEVVGFISSYRRPDRPDTLFVWQVAVAASERGRGVAKALLGEVLKRPEQAQIQYVEATIGPDNIPSRKLFIGLAAEREAECRIAEQYAVGMFPEGSAHEAELMYTIGPLRSS